MSLDPAPTRTGYPKSPHEFLARLDRSIEYSTEKYQGYAWPYLVELRTKWVSKVNDYDGALNRESRRQTESNEEYEQKVEASRVLMRSIESDMHAEHECLSDRDQCHGYKCAGVRYVREFRLDELFRMDDRSMPPKPASELPRMDHWQIWLATHEPLGVLKRWKAMLTSILEHENVDRVACHSEEGILQISKLFEKAAIALNAYGRIVEVHREIFPRLDRFDLYHRYCDKCKDVVHLLANYQLAEEALLVATIDAKLETDAQALMGILDTFTKEHCVAQKKKTNDARAKAAAQAKSKVYGEIRKEKRLKAGQKLGNLTDDQQRRLSEAENGPYEGSRYSLLDDPDEPTWGASIEKRKERKVTLMQEFNKSFAEVLKRGTDDPVQLIRWDHPHWMDWSRTGQTFHLFRSVKNQECTYRIKNVFMRRMLGMNNDDPDLYRYAYFQGWKELSHYTSPSIRSKRNLERLAEYIGGGHPHTPSDLQSSSSSVADQSICYKDLLQFATQEDHKFHFTAMDRRQFQSKFGHVSDMEFNQLKKRGLFAMQEEKRIRLWREGDVYVRMGVFRENEEIMAQEKEQRRKRRLEAEASGVAVEKTTVWDDLDKEEEEKKMVLSDDDEEPSIPAVAPMPRGKRSKPNATENSPRDKKTPARSTRRSARRTTTQ